MKLPFAGNAPRSTPAKSTPPPRRKPSATQARGQIGEDAAAHYLEKQRYRIVARNWRAGNALRGEIDGIAWDESVRPRVLCFIEVKARREFRDRDRRGAEYSAPQEAVTPAKQRQISRLANAFVSSHQLDEVPCRFDVVEVWLDEAQNPVRCALHRNAFDYCGDF